jgi:hypothetical protein
MGMQVSNEFQHLYHTITAANLAASVIYVWMFPGGIMETFAAGGSAIYLGDGTNDIAYHVGGNDVAGFRHDTGPVTWQCYVIDTDALPATFTTISGTEASLDLANITRIGAYYTTTVKSVGGVDNCFTDIIRYAAPGQGISITGGGSGTEGTFLEIATADRSTVTGTAYGLCRELGSGVIGLQGSITWGDTVSAAVDFLETDVTVIFEDRGFSTDKYGLTVVGNGTGTTSVVFGTRTGVGTGSNGVTFICPAGVGAFWDSSDTDIDTLGIYACVFNGYDQSFDFTTNATTGPSHEIFASTFVNCAQIVIGQTEFKNNNINGSANVATTGGAVLLEDDANVSGLGFASAGTGHAIEIASTTNSPFTFTDFTYVGYAASDGGTGNECLVNTSGATITINISGGDVPTVDTTNSTGTVIIVTGSVTTTVNVKDNTGTVLQNARVYLEAADGTGPLPYQDSVSVSVTTTVATVTHTAHGMAIGDQVKITGLNQSGYNGAKTIVTSADANTYTYTVVNDGAATGTPLATGILINELTTAGGVADDTRSTTDQPVTGHVRKSSVSPFFRSFPIQGTVSSTAGLTISVQMILDE